MSNFYNASGVPVISLVPGNLQAAIIGSNTAGVTASVSSGTMTLAGGNFVTLSQNAGNGITFHAAPGTTLDFYEPRPLLTNVSTAVAPGIGSLFFQSFSNPCVLGSGRINVLAVFSNSSLGILKGTTAGSIYASGTTGSRQVTYNFSSSMALYSRGANGNSSRLESVWSNTWTMGIYNTLSIDLSGGSNVSLKNSASIVFHVSIGTDGAYTNSTFQQTHNQVTAASSVCTSALTSGHSSLYNILSSQLQIGMGFNTSLAPGNYWLMMRWSSASTTSGSSIDVVWPIVNMVAIPGHTALGPYRPMSATVSTAASFVMPGNGTWTNATTAAVPATVAFTDVRSIASNYSWYWNYMKSAL